MNREAALKEAQTFLGYGAAVFDRVLDPMHPEDWALSIERVGRYWIGVNSFTHANGNSWEECLDKLRSAHA